MNKYEWNTKFATTFIDQFGTQIDFNPLHSDERGSMITYRTNGFKIGGEYTLRENGSDLFLGWHNEEFLVSPTEKGFDLLSGKSVEYSYTRIE